MNNNNLDLKKIENKRNRYLFLLGIAAAMAGSINTFTNNNGSLITIFRLLISLIAISIIYFWIIYDAKIRNYHIPKYIKYTIILFGIIGVPIYFWRSRSFKSFCLNLAGLWLFIYYFVIYYIFAVITAFFLFQIGYF